MQGDEILIIGKLVLTFAVLLGLPVWELVKLRREKRRRRREPVEPRSAARRASE